MTPPAFLTYPSALRTRSFSSPETVSALTGSNSFLFSSTTLSERAKSKRALLRASAEPTPPPSQHKQPEGSDSDVLPVPHVSFLLQLSANYRRAWSAFASHSGTGEKDLPTSASCDGGPENQRKRERRNKETFEHQETDRRQSAATSTVRSTPYSSQYFDTSVAYSDCGCDVDRQSKDEHSLSDLPNPSVDDLYEEDAHGDEHNPTHGLEKAPTQDVDVPCTMGLEGKSDEAVDVVYAGLSEHRLGHVWGGYEGGPPPQPPVFDTADPHADSSECHTDGGTHEDGCTDAHHDSGKHGGWLDGWFDSGSHHGGDYHHDGGFYDGGGSHDGGGYF